MTQTIEISLSGTTDLPPGKIAAVVTSLEMMAAPERRADPPGSEAFALEQLGAADVARYLAIYRRIGESWLWFSRLQEPRDRIEALLADPKIEAYALRHDGGDGGLLELDFRIEGEGELAFFGLDHPLVGRGAGRWLMNRALALAWAKPIARLWVHTCTLDHPSAPEFYQRSGFTPFKRGIEVADDPRLSGHLPLASASHHPVIG